MGWVEGWMRIMMVEVGGLIEQVETQTFLFGLEVFAIAKSKFDWFERGFGFVEQESSLEWKGNHD